MGIVTYSYDDKTQLSKNFNVREFRCKCGKVHNIKISTELIEKLQKMTDLVGADCVYISSGHRCATHDRNVGGSGVGPHIDGYAADCKFMKNGKPINTKLLSCVAQDLGFMGIANITKNYDYIHLDMKNRVYKGNEVINYHTLTTDFYRYYGISKSEVEKLMNGVIIISDNQSTSNTVQNDTPKTKKIIYPTGYSDEVKELQKVFSNKGYNILANGYFKEATYNICRKFTIEKNDRGPLTRWVQMRLFTLGYYGGIQDGIAGNMTMNAIKRFQKDNNLGQGYLGGTDWLYLNGGHIE